MFAETVKASAVTTKRPEAAGSEVLETEPGAMEHVDAGRFPSLSANSVHGDDDGRHSRRNVSQECVLWGAFLNTRKCFVFWALTSGTSACGPHVFIWVWSLQQLLLRSFTPLSPACSVNTS